MSVVSRRVVFSYLCILTGYSIFATYALSLRLKFYFPIGIYWFSFMFVSIPVLCEATFWRSSTKLRLFYMLSFSSMIHLQYAVVDSSPFLSSEDAVGDYRLADKIIDDSQWVPLTLVEWGFGFAYRFYPISNFIYATLSLLTGIPLLVVVKYLFIVKAFVVPPLADRWFRSFFHQRIAYLATVLFLASPGAILFPHKESFAMIFFFIGMYAIIRTEKSRQHLLIGFVSMLTLVMTHHFTTYIFLILLTSLFLARYFFKQGRSFKVSSQVLMLCWVVFTSWVAFIAWAIIARHQRLLYQAFFQVLFPGELTFSELLPFYDPYEKIIVWLGLGITVVSTSIGFLGYVRNRKKLSPSFFTITLFLIPLLGVASLFRFFPTSYNVLISHRAFEFGYITVGAFSALFFIRAIQSANKLTLKGALVGTIVAMILVGPIAGAMHPRTFARVSNVISSRAISLNSWMSQSDANNEYTIGDKVARLILEGYGSSLFIVYPEFFTSSDFNLPQDMGSKASYVITYKYMRDFYGPNVDKFDTSPYFHNIYTNGILNLHVVGYRASP